MIRSLSFKDTFNCFISGIERGKVNDDRAYKNLINEWTAQHNFRFPPPLVQFHPDDRFRVITEEPRPNTLLYVLLSQYNPWLDCEMTREKRAYLKPQIGEVACAVSTSGSGSDHYDETQFFRNETIIDITNLYLWPLLHSRADEVIACITFKDWRQLFMRTIHLAFPDYNEWTNTKRGAMSSCKPVTDQLRTARIMKYMTPARVLYLLTTRANFWPYGCPSSNREQRWSLSNSVSDILGLCSIKQKTKEYTDDTEIEWLVRADFLRNMKRVHLYITPHPIHSSSSSYVNANIYDTDTEVADTEVSGIK